MHNAAEEAKHLLRLRNGGRAAVVVELAVAVLPQVLLYTSALPAERTCVTLAALVAIILLRHLVSSVRHDVGDVGCDSSGPVQRAVDATAGLHGSERQLGRAISRTSSLKVSSVPQTALEPTVTASGSELTMLAEAAQNGMSPRRR
jgi:hypothetical protein